VGDPRALVERLTAAQNAHDLEAMVACFADDYRSEQPLSPGRTFRGGSTRCAWGRLYVDEVEQESVDIDAAVRRMAGTEER
jgi:hypothetical protein